MDIKEEMVLIKREDKTEEISNIHYDLKNGKVKITYRGGSTIYPYSQNSVVIIKELKVIELDGHAAYVDDMPIYEPQLILDFGERIRIIQYSGESLTVRPQSFSLVKDRAANQTAQQIQAYLRDISQYTTDNPEEEAF